MDLWLIFWLFIAAYTVATLVGIAHTCFNWLVLKIENEKPEIKTMYDITSYAKTVPYHPLYNIIIWPIAAYMYFQMAHVSSADVWMTSLILGVIWFIVTIVLDLFGWVLVRHPWSMTWKEMYVDYQPWITLIYISIFVAPFIAALFIP